MTTARFCYPPRTAEAVREGPRGPSCREMQGLVLSLVFLLHRTKPHILLARILPPTKDVQGRRWFLNSLHSTRRSFSRFDARRTHVHRSPGTATTQPGQSARRVCDVGPHGAPLRRERSDLCVRCHPEQRTPPLPLSSFLLQHISRCDMPT